MNGKIVYSSNKPYSKGSPLIKVQVPKRLQRELPTRDKYIA